MKRLLKKIQCKKCNKKFIVQNINYKKYLCKQCKNGDRKSSN